MPSSKNLQEDSFFIKNFLKSLPSKKDISDIQKYTEQIHNRHYKKIIFVAFGTSYQILQLVTRFYTFSNHDWQIKIINNDDKETREFIHHELLKENLIIFCSRAGNSHEIINQLKILIKCEDDEELKKIKNNILILTNYTHPNKTCTIAKDNKLQIININHGNCGRFEFFNSIFFFTIKLLNPIIDINHIHDSLLNEKFYENIFNSIQNEQIDQFLSTILKKNHLIIIYSSNYILNGFLTWFKHIWYESFGKSDINIRFENHSSLFHSSIQYYLNHHEDFYHILQFHSDKNLKNYIEEDLKIYLENCTVEKFEVKNDIFSLIEIIVKITSYIKYLSKSLEIDIFNQSHVDFFKNKFLNN
jgi:glucose-6-phosphate isomerase